MTTLCSQSFVKTLDTLGLQPNSNLLVAVSGGVDSAVLLWLLYESCAKNHHIGIVHVDHMLRGDESDKDRRLVERISLSYGFKCHVYRRPVKRLAKEYRQSVELIARHIRYNLFNALCIAENYDYVLLAHHKQDLAESVVMHLTRGCGLDGLVGMRPVTGNLVRPLLAIDKADLYAVAKIHQIKFREDKSNQDINYTRNHIRHQVMPALKNINPMFDDAILRLSHLVDDDSDYLNRVAEDALKHCFKKSDNNLMLSEYKNQHPAIRRRLLIQLIRGFKRQASIQSAHIAILDDWLCQPNAKGMQSFYGLQFLRSSAVVNVLPTDWGVKDDCPKVCLNFGDNKINAYGLNITISHQPMSTNNIVIDKAMFDRGVTVRTRRTGDYIKLKGLDGHSKTLKKLYNESKVPVKIRQKLPVLTVNDEVIWVKGLRASIYFNADSVKHPVYIHITKV